MALTQDQLDAIEFGKASQMHVYKADLIRLAKDILIENDRSKPAEERGVTAEEIIAYADKLNTYVQQ